MKKRNGNRSRKKSLVPFVDTCLLIQRPSRVYTRSCKQCIEKSIESNKKMASMVCCPLCRAPLPGEDMLSVPTNFTINHLVEIFDKRKEAGKSLALREIKCSTCEDGLLAVA